MIGKDIARFHTIFWPAMLWSAGLEAPDHVWVHGWLLVAGERMSKSRGNFLDPHAVVAAFGADAARYITLAEVAFDKDTDVSWDSFVRRYNADLANDFGNLVNRTVSMVNRYLGGERPEPRATDDAPLASGWSSVVAAYRDKLDGYLLHDALSALWDFVGEANKTVDAEQPWTLNKQAKAGDADAEARLRSVLGDLVEACRLIGLAGRAVHAGDGAAGPRAARLPVPVRRRRQRRAGAPRAARLGRGRGPRPGHVHALSAVPEPRERGGRRAVSRGPPGTRRGIRLSSGSTPRPHLEVPAMAKGSIAHIEFPADDLGRATRFYSAVAGWEFGRMDEFPDYELFRNGEASGGAVGLRGRTVGTALRIYIDVESLEEGIAAALANGGAQVEPPTEIGGGMGRFAVVRDPEGNEVGLWESPAPPAA